MLKKPLALLVCALTIVCCASPSPSPTITNAICESQLLSGISLSSTFAYTFDAYSISGTKFCNQDLVSVLVNDTEVSLSDIQTNKITFSMPSLLVDSVSIKIKTKTTTIDLKSKIALFPSYGIWKEVQSFPNEGRYFTQSMAYDGRGYVSGGRRYTGYTTTYNDTYYNELFGYDPIANTWSLLETNDFLKNKQNGTIAAGKLFLIPWADNGPATTYTFATKVFGETNLFNGSSSISNVPFSIGSNAYVCNVERNSSTNIFSLVIRKYNNSTNTWDLALTGSTGSSISLINFAFEYSGMAYFGVNELNSDDCQIYSFNPITNQLAPLAKINIHDPFNSHSTALKHLFTIGNLAYFIEPASFVTGETYSEIVSPKSILYMYNLKTNTFRSINHNYPETFSGISSFSIINRGFAGLSTSLASPLFTYSQRFYEFIPK